MTVSFVPSKFSHFSIKDNGILITYLGLGEQSTYDDDDDEDDDDDDDDDHDDDDISFRHDSFTA